MELNMVTAKLGMTMGIYISYSFLTMDKSMEHLKTGTKTVDLNGIESTLRERNMDSGGHGTKMVSWRAKHIITMVS